MPFSIRYDRAGIEVALCSLTPNKSASQIMISARLPILPQGSISIGTTKGDIGFDNITLKPLDDPRAVFNFTDNSDPARQDWHLIRKGHEFAWDLERPLKQKDVLIYRSPFWSNAQVSLFLYNVQATKSISILYPYVSPQRYMRVRLDTRPDSFIQLSRNYDGHEKSLEKASVRLLPNHLHNISIQSNAGLLAVFLDGNRITETNEYELLEGTIAFMVDEDLPHLPISQLKIERKEIIIDNFPLTGKGTLLPSWRIKNGKWKVATLFEGGKEWEDGQLTAQGRGTILIGKNTWKGITIQSSVYLAGNPKFALLAGVNHDDAVELYFNGQDLQLRKVSRDNPLILAKTTIKNLSNGWHRLGLSLSETGIKAEIDERTCLETTISTQTGCAGMRNYGDFVAFDDLTIHVLSEEEEHQPAVSNVDSLFVDIEDSLLKGSALNNEPKK